MIELRWVNRIVTDSWGDKERMKVLQMREHRKITGLYDIVSYAWTTWQDVLVEDE